MDSLDKLNNTYSSLKNESVFEEEYRYCQQRMQTFRDILIWYTNRDVQPFCHALQKKFNFWREKNIDMLKHGISIPGVAMIYLFSTLAPGVYFSLIHERNKDLYYFYTDN